MVSRDLATETTPEAKIKFSYGENGSFELDPDPNGPFASVDWPGKPATWHQLSQTPAPAATVFYGELAITTVMNDHFMPYLWTSDANAAKEIDGARHSSRSNYVFVDDHVEPRPMAQVFKWDTDMTKRIDRLNPMLAAH